MMLVGSPPFYGDSSSDADPNRDTAAMFAAIIKGKYDWPADVAVSDEAKDFVGQLLVVDSEKRASAAAAVQRGGRSIMLEVVRCQRAAAAGLCDPCASVTGSVRVGARPW